MTFYTHPLARQIAATLAKGCYQRSRLRPYAVWSNADLKGAARKYGDRYESSRWALIRRLQAHPMLAVKVTQYKGGHGNGRRDVTIGLRVASHGLEGMHNAV